MKYKIVYRLRRFEVSVQKIFKNERLIIFAFKLAENSNRVV